MALCASLERTSSCQAEEFGAADSIWVYHLDVFALDGHQAHWTIAIVPMPPLRALPSWFWTGRATYVAHLRHLSTESRSLPQ